MKKIYLASPFFNEKETMRVCKVMNILKEKGLEVFVPMEHQSPELEFGSREWRDKTFRNDVDHIDWCDVVVVNLTGETINLMIADSLHALIKSYDELKEYDFEKMPVREYENYVW